MSGMMARMSSREDWRRVADAIIRRRAERGWTQMDLAQRGPLSLDRVQSLEGAKRTSYRAGTIAAIERALEWEYGSVQAILSGGRPLEMRENVPSRGVRTEYRFTEQQVREMARQLPRDVIRQIYEESEAVPDDSVDAPGAPESWERKVRAIEELTKEEREHIIVLVKALRGATSPGREQGEGVHRASGT